MHISSTVLSVGESAPGALCLVLGPQYERDLGILGRAQQRATRVIRGLQHLSCEEWLRIRHGEEGAWGELISGITSFPQELQFGGLV